MKKIIKIFIQKLQYYIEITNLIKIRLKMDNLNKNRIVIAKFLKLIN